MTFNRYIDTEGALLTSSGGRFGQEFDDVLASFSFGQVRISDCFAEIAA